MTDKPTLRVVSVSGGKDSTACAILALEQYPRNIGFAVEALAAEGLIALKWSRWRLTRRGREAMPTISSLPPMVPYVPPAVVRRPGSDHSHIPSLAGGQLIQRRTA